jgi:CheY-specific phosphatase CheX
MTPEVEDDEERIKEFREFSDKMSSDSELRANEPRGEWQMKAQVDEQCVINANSQFWEQMLAMTLAPMATPNEFSVAPGHVMGSVSLGGVWKGRIEVRMAEGLAYQATAAMMMQPLDTVVEADALDATKEIANMIAGTIKSSLPRPCTMTVPEAGVEVNAFCIPPLTEDSLIVAFRHESGDLMVRVCEEECA